MLKVLIHNILLITLMLSLTGESIGQHTHSRAKIPPVSIPEQQVYSSTQATVFMLLLQQNSDMVSTTAHSNIAPGIRSYLLPIVFLHSNKAKKFPFLHFLPDWYFHPYSTLGKTKYYVFALGEIIV